MPDLYITEKGTLIDLVQTGIEFLAEVVKDNLLNRIMTDLYSPNFGTDIKSLPSTNLSNKRELELKMTLYLDTIQRKIIDEQNMYPSQNQNEMLQKLDLIDLREVTDIQGITNWLAVIQVTNISNETYIMESGLA